MDHIFDFKKQLPFFPITFARLWYGSGPFGSHHRPSADDKPNPNEDQPKIFLELKAQDSELSRFLGKKPAIAHIYRDPTGKRTNEEGVTFRGVMYIGEFADELGVSTRYVQIDALLPLQTYDAVAPMLITNGSDLLSRCSLQIGLKEEESTIDFKMAEDPLKDVSFFVEDLAIIFDIGRQYDGLTETDGACP